MSNSYQEYLDHYTTYKTKYGSKTAIFMMVGIFYELYDVRDPETGQGRTTVLELVDLLGLKVSVKKGEGPGGLDGIVAGIPDYAIHKWAGRLTSTGWTVVLVEQVKNTAGKVIRREAQRILTPGSHMEAVGKSDVYLTFVSIEKVSDAPYLSVVSLDLTTGYLRVYETKANGTEDAWTCNDIVQFMELYPPKEVLWSCEGPLYFCERLTDGKLRSIIGCTSQTLFHKRTPLAGAWKTPLFREEYLTRRCQIKNLLPTHTALHLNPGSRSETALLSLLSALDELWPSLSLGCLLTYPWTPTSSLRLGENALVQLHMIVPEGQNQDVLSLFDSCATPMGKRLLRERLLKPSASFTEIQTNLNQVDIWSRQDKVYRESITKTLRTFSDLNRLFRKIQQGSVSATDLIGLHTTLKGVNQILTTGEVNDSVLQANKFVLKEIFTVFSQTKIYESTDDTSLFVNGFNESIDLVESEIASVYSSIKEWIRDRAASVNVSPDSLKVDLKEKSLVVKGPKSLIETLKRSGKLPAGCTATVQKTCSYLESTELDHFFGLLQRYRSNLSQLQGQCLIDVGSILSRKILDSWLLVSEWCSQMDVNMTLAKVALDMGYVKPTLIEGDTGSLQIQGLRHPLLEAQDRKIPYVQHDISLGSSESNGSSQGWLLYGLNASGKSSLMRATGLAVLLAQAGSFVPAQSMTLCPFSSVHTRIINTDNLWMGLSSFAVEMSEMRDIFQSAGPKSLVLGDELCSGTETTSATALVAAGLSGLLKRGARFLFATHLHGLNQISEVVTNPLLQIWHLHVEYDQINDRLVYHRTLKKGSGSSLYGLEVAKAMRIPSDILEDAIRFRKQIAGEADLNKSVGSSWNSQIIRRTCETCGAKEADDLEVHHIKPRATALQGRLSDGSSVHSSANLIVLCETCHDSLHRDEFEIGPILQTSDGLERSTTMSAVSSLKSVKSKWSVEDLQTIKTESEKYSHLTLPNLVKYLKNQHTITISTVSLRKLLAGP